MTKLTLNNGMTVRLDEFCDEDEYKHPVVFGSTWTIKKIEALKEEITQMYPGYARDVAEAGLSIIEEAYRKANATGEKVDLEWKL